MVQFHNRHLFQNSCLSLSSLAGLCASPVLAASQQSPIQNDATTVIVTANQGASMNGSTLSLTQSDLLELGLMDGRDLAQYIDMASTRAVTQPVIVFVDGKLAGGIEVLRDIPIQSVLAMNLLEGAEASAYGAPAGVSVVLVFLDEKTNIRRLESQVGASEDTWNGSSTFNLLKRSRSRSWTLQASTELSQSNAPSPANTSSVTGWRTSLKQNLEFRSRSFGDFSIGSRLTHMERSQASSQPERAELPPVANQSNGSISLSWSKKILPIGWIVSADTRIATSSQLRASINENFEHNDGSRLFLAGPILPWGPEAVFLSFNEERGNINDDGGDGNLEENATTKLLNVFVPVSRLFDGSEPRPKQRVGIAISHQNSSNSFGRQTSDGLELVYASGRRLRISAGHQRLNRLISSLVNARCDESDLSINEVTRSYDNGWECHSEIGKQRSDSTHLELFLGSGLRGSWSASTRWTRITPSKLQTDIQSSLAQDDRNQLDLKLKLWGQFFGANQGPPPVPRHRWELSFSAAWEERPFVGALDRTTAAVQGRLHYKARILGLELRGSTLRKADSANAEAWRGSVFLDFPIIAPIKTTPADRSWRDGPRIRLELIETKRDNRPPSRRIGVRLATGF